MIYFQVGDADSFEKRCNWKPHFPVSQAKKMQKMKNMQAGSLVVKKGSDIFIVNRV